MFFSRYLQVKHSPPCGPFGRRSLKRVDSNVLFVDGRLSARDLQVEIGPPTPINHFWGHNLRDGSM